MARWRISDEYFDVQVERNRIKDIVTNEELQSGSPNTIFVRGFSHGGNDVILTLRFQKRDLMVLFMRKIRNAIH